MIALTFTHWWGQMWSILTFDSSKNSMLFFKPDIQSDTKCAIYFMLLYRCYKCLSFERFPGQIPPMSIEMDDRSTDVDQIKEKKVTLGNLGNMPRFWIFFLWDISYRFQRGTLSWELPAFPPHLPRFPLRQTPVDLWSFMWNLERVKQHRCGHT